MPKFVPRRAFVMNRKPYLVGIVGGSASGKTTFLRELVARIPPKTCAVVSQDNYYRNIDEQERDNRGIPNFDLPTAIYRDLLYDDIAKLLRGESIVRTEYTFNERDRLGHLITTEPSHVIIVEGLFIFHYEEIRNLLDLRVFIDADIELCRIRRIERDQRERGYAPDFTAYQWTNHVLPAYQHFILPYREQSHLIVANHGAYARGLEVIADHITAQIRA